MNILRHLIVLAAMTAATVKADPTVSATALFESTIHAHFDNALPCWKPARGIPSLRTIDKEIRATIEAATTFYDSDPEMMYLLYNIGLSEGGGHIRNNVKPGEKSWGWTCMTIPEVRRVCKKYEWLKQICPKRDVEVQEKLDADPRFCMLMTAATMRIYQNECKGDYINALMIYKHGERGLLAAINKLRREKPNAPMTELYEWKKYIGLLDWLHCIRDRVLVDSIITCGCMAAEEATRVK